RLHADLLKARFLPLIVILTNNTTLVKQGENSQMPWCSNPQLSPGSITSMERWEKAFGTQQTVQRIIPIPFDYWAGPSDQGRRVFQAGSVFKRPFTNLDDTFTICEKRWNYTIETRLISFGYKCEELGRGVDAKARSLHQESGEAEAPFSFDSFNELKSNGNQTWIVDGGPGVCVIPQLNDT
ncbi:formylmethionine deformylase-like protein, partial [Colletotrichum asianum]